MRTDHHAFQRATRIAGFGLMLQSAIGLTLLIFGRLTEAEGDSLLLFAAAFVLAGLLVWLSLLVIFYQHRMERLEALETDELAASRTAAGSAFEGGEEQNVAARRLRLMHQWLMPIASLVLAAGLGFIAWMILQRLDDSGTDGLALTTQLGWTLAICLAMAAVSFIFSRFVAGMAKQPAWQNLRGGAAFMVGNCLVLLALSVLTFFRILDPENTRVVSVIAYALPIFMLFAAAEIVLNFILNLYRPRIAGETPRPAFDSKAMSLLAAPDSLVRSLNEAVNYQFGFDVTSSWGYQLLLRSFVGLIAFGVVVLVLLNTMVIVEPHQMAVRLRAGAIVTSPDGAEHVHPPGVMWKWPWPIESAEVHDVTRVRTLHLTPQFRPRTNAFIWTDKLGDDWQPFVVGRSETVAGMDAALTEPASVEVMPSADDLGGTGAVEPGQIGLVDAEIALLYRVKHDARGDGLRDYLRFSSDARGRRQELDARRRALKAIALREVSRFFFDETLEEVLSSRRGDLGPRLQASIQKAFDAHHAGIEVVAVNVPILRPAGTAVENFGELDIKRQTRRQLVAIKESNRVRGFTGLVGDVKKVDPIMSAIEAWDAARRQHGSESREAVDRRETVERLIDEAGGRVAAELAAASLDRWANVIDARAEAERFKGQLAAYEAAPGVYRQQRLREVFATMLRPLRKVLVAVDPSQLDVNVQFKDLNPVLTADTSVADDERGETNP
jgi:regulator of protease activity HflC (stomatin/prohibitin superfamily)